MLASKSPWLRIPVPRGDVQVRLICFPHGGGGPLAYSDWAEHLPEWLEVVCIQPPGRGARLRDDAIRDIAVMRSQVADAISECIEGPYALFGHSVGALVAFETALELERRSATLPLRVFLSSFGGPGEREEPKERPLYASDDELLLDYLRSLGHGASDVIEDNELLQLMLSAVRADFELAEKHCFAGSSRLNTPITVLGGAGDATVPLDRLRSWRARAGGPFDEICFPGGHFYTESAKDELLSYVSSTLRRDRDALPKSLSFGTREDYPRAACLHDLFRAQAKRTPDAVALIDPARACSEEITFAELDDLSDLLARRFLEQGCRPGQTVAILMEPCAEFLIACLAVLKAGGAYLPIPVVTPDAGIADILAAAQPVTVATKPSLVNRLPQFWRGASHCVALPNDWSRTIIQQPLGDLSKSSAAEAGDPAYCVMTSGTTGKPKGIIGPHRGAVNSYCWRYAHLPYRSEEREACNVFFVWEALRPLLQGHPAVIIPDETIFDPRRLIEFLEKHRVTRVLFTPSLLETLLAAAGDSLADRLSKLRVVILNGEVVASALARRFAEALPHVSLVNDYSISECHDVATMVITADTNASLRQQRYPPVGRPMSNVNVYVLDAAMQPVPIGVSGEIYVGGDSIAIGYLKAPEETAMRFLDDPFAHDVSESNPHARMFRTGDVGRILPNGGIEISGRTHFMVKLRGYSIVPEAIEAEICSFADCAAAAVIAVNDPKTEQPQSLLAYIVSANRNNQIDQAALRAHLKQRLPHYAIPGDFMELPALPIDQTTGKVDRPKLPAPSIASAAEPALTNAHHENDFTARIAALWSRVLRVPTVSPGDNFFDLGGHSLLAAEMTRVLAEEFGIEADVIDVFDTPRLIAYAKHILAKHRLGKPTIPDRAATVIDRSRGGPADIAVIGMAGRFPSARSVADLWQLVCAGGSAIRCIDDEELRRRGVAESLISNPAYVKAGAVLDDVADFDPRFWGLSHQEATIMDPQQRLFLECCWHALEAAGHRPDDEGGNIGVFAGCYLPSYLINHLGAETHFDPANPAKFHLAEIGNDKDYLASRVAHLMNLTGPAISVQTSCSTGLVAIAQAASALRSGQCDMALAGASSITFPQGGFVSAEGHIGTSSGTCRAFDASADGTILGDGVGAVLLRRLEDARADGDDVLAVIKGHAINNDGAAKAGYSAPCPSGQAAVIRRALQLADVQQETVGYVEAHGTGTHLGDPIEVRGLAEAYRPEEAQTGSCALGSIKPNIGHSNIAAGLAGFIKAVLTVRHGTIPPLAGFQRENPELHLDETPFYIPRQAEDWETQADHPRRAGISSFGIGGTNCHVIIEQAPVNADTLAAEQAPAEAPQHILPISAKTEEASIELASRLADYLRTHPEQPLADIAATLQSGRTEFAHRIAVVAATHEEAARALSQRIATCGADGLPPRESELEKIARQWAAGGAVDWSGLRSHRTWRRISLPAYPFARIRCWPDHDRAFAPAADASAELVRETRSPWQQMLYLPSWGRTAAPTQNESGWQGTYILLSPADGPSGEFAEQIAAELTSPQARVLRLRIGTGQDAHKQILPQLIGRIEACEGAIRIVDLSALGVTPSAVEEAVSMTADLTALLAGLSRLASTKAIAYWLVGDAILKVQDEVTRPLLAPLIGPLLAASQENPRLQARLIDLRCGDSAQSVKQVAEELRSPEPRPEPLVALRGRYRWVERFEALKVVEASRQRGITYLTKTTGPHVITGGRGRIGLALAKRLTSLGCSVALLSRHLPENEPSWRAAQFGDASHLVRTYSCDVADASALQSTLDRITQKAGGLGGIFHAAGLADLHYIDATTHASIAAECETKIAGTENLREALGKLQTNGASSPEFVFLFSSLASTLGGLGMAGYAAANRYLDAAVAEMPEGGGIPWISTNFDDWDFDYDMEQVGAYAHTRQGLAIPVDDGLTMIEAILGAPDAERVVVAATPIGQRIAKWGRLPAIATIVSEEMEPTAQGAKLNGIATATPDSAVNVQAIVLMAYAKVIGSRDLALDSNFFELGGDSLLAAQLAMELRGALSGGDAGIGEIFDFPTPRQLAGHLQRQPPAIAHGPPSSKD